MEIKTKRSKFGVALHRHQARIEWCLNNGALLVRWLVGASIVSSTLMGRFHFDMFMRVLWSGLGLWACWDCTETLYQQRVTVSFKEEDQPPCG